MAEQQQQQQRQSRRITPGASPRRPVRQQQQQQQQGANRSLPVVATPRAVVPVVNATPATTKEKIKYTAVSGIGSGVLLGVLGMHSMGAIVGAGVGLMAWTFSDEIRAAMASRAAATHNKQSQRPNWLSWQWWNSPRAQGQQPQAAQSAPQARELEGEEEKSNVAEEGQEEEQDVLLRLGRGVRNRQRFDPPINSVLGKGAIIMGSQGTGKTNIVGLFAQAVGDKQVGMPLVIIDYKGEFHPLCDVLANGIIAGHPSYEGETHYGFFALTVKSAPQLAQILMEGPFQVILDITTYNGDNDQVANVIATLLHALVDWSRERRRTGQEPWPCLLITDEAHNFLPQKQSLSALAMEHPKESFGALTSAYSRMANTGRSYGYTLIMATQRLPNIAKWAIANLQIKVVLAHAEKNDLDACEEETGGMVSREEIKALARGTGIVIGFTKEPALVKFDKQRARHISNTPQVEDLRKQFKQVPRQRLSRVLATRPTTLRQTEEIHAPAAAPAEEMPEQHAVLPRRLYPVPAPTNPADDRIVDTSLREEGLQSEAPVQPAHKEISDSDLARAFAYHQQGYTSYRKLHRYTKPRHGWSEQKCRDLIEAMKERSLIEQGDDHEQAQ